MPLRLLEPLAEAGSIGYLYLHFQSVPLQGWDVTPERLFWAVGGILFCGFYAGKVWREFFSMKSKAANDYQDIKEIKESLSKITWQLDHNRSDIEKDLIMRRAAVDKEITILTLGVAALERRAAMSESRHNRLRDAFNRLVGLAAPILKDADLDMSRVDTVSKIIGAAYCLPDEPDSGGNET